MSDIVAIVAGGGGLGLAVAAFVFAWGRSKRADGAIDARIALLERYHSLERLFDARGVAMTERDRIISGLQTDARRAAAALEAAGRALPKPKDSADAAQVARDALAALRALAGLPPEGGVPGVPGAAAGSPTEDRRAVGEVSGAAAGDLGDAG